MVVTAETIKKLIVALGFVPADGEADVFHKKYTQHDGYVLRVDFTSKTIEYIDSSSDNSASINIGSKSTSNFAQQENFVVLECVNRLLEKGYSPSSIELEKVYPSGKGHSGELDILVSDKDGQAFLMIECKTWDKEYSKETEKMLASGGQLFSYFKNATSAKSLCLYTSQLVGSTIEYDNSIVDVSEDWKSLSETKDIHERWNKVFKKNGIFEDYASPYNIIHKRLTYSDLETMKDEDSRKIFHQIMTILRHNGVSDKPNAFNKLLNLFVCKIIDEDKNPDEELQFQCWEGLTNEKLQMTLNDLYKEGMWRFLEIKVIDHSESDVDSVLKSLGIDDNAHKQKLMEMFSDTRLKKSPNFAFIEVQDEKTFQLNAKIVREIVELLQHYKFRYEQKHEFLGDFFEKMLNTSMKQEAGQFFTPVPITRFIISSLPLRDFVQSRIDNKDHDSLPTVIDYACGSGHFLTEFMSAMQSIIETVDVSNAPPSASKKLKSWRGDVKYSWADEHVYGIDFDNRLVKTAKVSAFFNGDGEATIIWGDGLDSFEHSEVYRGKLKETMPNKQDNGQFDILISNPPYSVDTFRRMLKYGAESFDLYSSLTDNSSEIECLFIERMKQLLKVGGWAGVILPSSILSNSGIYSRARDIIFKYFNVKAIVELGSGTFMETGTNTVILFLERRPDSDNEKITKAINTFFTNKRDVAVAGFERAFSAYVTNVYNDLSYEDYLSFINENPNSKMMEHGLYKDHVKELGDNHYTKAFEVEKDKMLYFLLTCNQNTIIAKSGQKQDEKAFLGYEFSKRRGHEGIKILPKGTILFDKSDVLNSQKINSYIYNAFLGKLPEIVDEAVVKYISCSRTSNLIEYGTSKFFKRINLRAKSTFEGIRRNKDIFAELGTICDVISGQSPESKYYNEDGDGLPFYQGKTEFTEKFLGAPRIWTTSVTKKSIKGDIVMSVRAPVGPVNFVENDICIGRGLAAIRCDKSKVIPVYVFHLLLSMQGEISGRMGMAFDSISRDDIFALKIPVPSLDIQQQIVDAFEYAFVEIEAIKERAKNAQKSIEVKFLELFGDPVSNPMDWQTSKLIEVTTKIGSGATPRGGESSYAASGISLIRSMNVYNGYFKYDGLAFITDEQAKQLNGVTVHENDVLLNITGASVARTCVVPSDVLPARVNQHVSIIRCDSSRLNHMFANTALTTESYQRTLISIGESAGMSRQAITKTQIENLTMIVPPVELQNDFARFCTETHATITSYQNTLNETLKKRNEILSQYL
ncbi:MAG: N-6 DNA methylase [Oscillospiraceae bacterium]|jgi:type I restriction enzyme M protein|nr:N-6 DNA methylase [Oscillospiraceae bacterium]